jgi:hypothetical protein
MSDRRPIHQFLPGRFAGIALMQRIKIAKRPAARNLVLRYAVGQQRHCSLTALRKHPS